jgi:hypothetical protein
LKKQQHKFTQELGQFLDSVSSLTSDQVQVVNSDLAIVTTSRSPYKASLRL